MEEHGLTPAALETQLKNFREGFPFLPVTRAASCGDGIRVLDAAGIEQAAARYDRAKESLRVVKFVPASGAATRMFKDLFEFVREGRRTAVVGELLANRRRFAFWPELRTIVGDDADELRTVENIVAEGLRYGETPKGLVSFHRYGDEVRKAVEEHLVEGAQYAAAGGEVKIHFTVSPEHLTRFEALLAEKIPGYESRFGVKYRISFSVQDPSTDTLAVNPDCTPFRRADGRLLFRPAGHGAAPFPFGEWQRPCFSGRLILFRPGSVQRYGGFLRSNGPDAEDKVQNMTYPHHRQYGTSRRHTSHHGEAEGHRQCDNAHDAQLGCTGHASSAHKAFQIILVQSGTQEPIVQAPGAACKAKSRQHQERKRGQQRDGGAHRAQAQTDTAKDHVKKLHSAASNFFFSRFVSITCRAAATGWCSNMRGPAQRITARIFSLISGR